jgi:AcrR family transcriptional regulator
MKVAARPAADESAAPAGKPQRRRVRMAPDERERAILDAAVHFFARHGFSAQLRELAREMKVSQGLIYRYFSSKQALLDRVYEHNFSRRWDPAWENLLADRSRPLRERLTVFYTDYLAAIDDPEWIRLVMYSGLDGNDLTRRYIRSHVEGLLRLIARECRDVEGKKTTAEPSQAEMELVWHLHSTAIYYLVRKHIFGTATVQDKTTLVAMMIGDFLSGLGGDVALPEIGRITIPRKRKRPCP